MKADFLNPVDAEIATVQDNLARAIIAERNARNRLADAALETYGATSAQAGKMIARPVELAREAAEYRFHLEELLVSLNNEKASGKPRLG